MTEDFANLKSFSENTFCYRGQPIQDSSFSHRWVDKRAQDYASLLQNPSTVVCSFHQIPGPLCFSIDDMSQALSLEFRAFCWQSLRLASFFIYLYSIFPQVYVLCIAQFSIFV